MENSNPRKDNDSRTPWWALIGAPIGMLLFSAGAFWSAYQWMSLSTPLPPADVSSPTAVMNVETPRPVFRVAKRPAVPDLQSRPPGPVGNKARKPSASVEPPQVAAATEPKLSLPEVRWIQPESPRQIHAPCPIQVSESRLALGRSTPPPLGRHVAIVLHRSGSTAEGNHEAERQVLSVVGNLGSGDSFTVVATAGQGSIFAVEPVSPQPESVEALRTWMKALPASAAANLESGVSIALSMPAINKVVVVADVAPEREAETWRRLSDVVRTGNRFGAAVSAVTLTPRCVPAVAPTKERGSGSSDGIESPSVAREGLIVSGF